MPHITVLRLSHRAGRDPRISTHLGLTSRVYGAKQFLLAGDKDSAVLESLDDVKVRFGGEMQTRHEESPLGFLRNFIAEGGVAVHLTMYGLPYQEVIPEIPADKPIVVVVGGAKVSREYYEMCQFNVAVGNQPHSEVAALAGFLERLNDGVSPPDDFKGGKLEIYPTERGKDMRQEE
jgi:tRNA (cytidine56-2'-O)-methyltransferase